MIRTLVAIGQAVRRGIRVWRMHRMIEALHAAAAASGDRGMLLAILKTNREFIDFASREFTKDDALLRGRR